MLGRKLAKVSGSPGKTRMMNVFLVENFYFLDLPGYGWARVSQVERAAFHLLLDGVLRRPRIAGAVWLLDLRRDPSPDDQAMQDLLSAGGVRVLAAFTKADKLPRGQQRDRARELRVALRLEDEQTVSTSAKTGDGVADLKEAIAELVRGAR